MTGPFLRRLFLSAKVAHQAHAGDEMLPPHTWRDRRSAIAHADSYPLRLRRQLHNRLHQRLPGLCSARVLTASPATTLA
jgi:hypothetical protein